MHINTDDRRAERSYVDTAKVFLSYASAQPEPEYAERLREVLDGLGYDVWLDKHIQTGDAWHEEIEMRLAAAACVIVLWSQKSVSSAWVRYEAAHALGRNVYLGCTIETDVQIPVPYGRLQVSALPGWDGTTKTAGFPSLLEKLKGLVGPPSETILLSKDPWPQRVPRNILWKVREWAIANFLSIVLSSASLFAVLTVIIAVYVALSKPLAEVRTATNELATQNDRISKSLAELDSRVNKVSDVANSLEAANRRYSQPIKDIELSISFSISGDAFAAQCSSWIQNGKPKWLPKMNIENFRDSDQSAKLIDAIHVCHNDETGLSVDILQGSNYFPKAGIDVAERGTRHALCPPLVALAFFKPRLKDGVITKFLGELDKNIPKDKQGFPPGKGTVYSHHESFPRDDSNPSVGKSRFWLHYNNPANGDAILESNVLLASGFKREEKGAQLAWLEDLCGSQLILCLTRDNPDANESEQKVFSGVRQKIRLQRLALTIAGHPIELADGKRNVSERGNYCYEFTLPATPAQLFSPDETKLSYSELTQ